MQRSNRTLLIIILLLIAAAAAFWFLDFHVSRAELATNSQASRYTMSLDEAHPLPQGKALDLYVMAPDRLEPALAEALVEKLQGNPYVGAVTLRDEPLQAANGSVLVVRVEESSSFLWTPFYTKMEADVDMAYASDGDVAWIDVRPVVFTATDETEPTVRLQATLAFDGSGYGLISSPAYTHYVAEELARQINDLLHNQLATAGA